MIDRVHRSGNKNILILSAGRRVELIESFKNAAAKYKDRLDCRILAADMNPKLSSACYIADAAFSLPHSNEASFISELIQLCNAENVSFVVPTNDNELLVLAKNTSQLELAGVTPIISSLSFVEKCRDKRLSGVLFNEMGIRYPNIFDREEINYPCFCKPYNGSSSIGAFKIKDESELTEEVKNNPQNMFMELIPENYSEYTVDMYFDRNSNIKCIIPRERIATRAGEVSKGITRKNFVYEILQENVNSILGAVGCITVQVFGDPVSKQVVGLEVNPRFGGGYPLSVASGADYADFLIREYLLNEELPWYENWQDNTLMLRYDAKVIVKNASI